MLFGEKQRRLKRLLRKGDLGHQTITPYRCLTDHIGREFSLASNGFGESGFYRLSRKFISKKIVVKVAQDKEVAPAETSGVLKVLDMVSCVSAWNIDPSGGVTGVQF